MSSSVSVPITLILVMLGLGMYILMGQVATYLMTAELNRRNEVVRDCAYALAWHVADHLGSDQGESCRQSVHSTLASAPGRACRPSCVWMAGPFKSQETQACPDSLDGASTVFLGLVAAGREYALAADVRVEQPSHRVEVFAYESAGYISAGQPSAWNGLDQPACLLTMILE
jgi:hypothetical protein